MKSRNLLSIIFVFCFFAATAQVSHTSELQKHVTYLASEELEGRGLGTQGKDLATAYIREQFVSAGLKPFNESYLQEFSLKIGLARVKATNIIGLVEGTDPLLKEEYIVLGAHYDHLGYSLHSKNDIKTVYPGADDNASGVATIIELAKYFNQPENRPKRSLLFVAFDAEESGLLGAKHFVKKAEGTLLEQIKVMFSFDMVGMLEANKGLNLKGIATLVNGKEIAQKYSGDIKLLNTRPNIEARTDTEPFGLKGIPAIHVFTGTKSPYHQPQDIADLLDYPGMATIADYMAKVITELGNKQQLDAVSPLKKLQSNHKAVMNRFQAGVVLNLGSGMHVYKDEFYNAKNAFAYSAGIQLNYKLTRVTHLNLEGLYDYNTSKSAAGTFKRHSITIPFNVELGTPTTFGNSMRLFVFGGAYYRYNFDGKDGSTKLDYDTMYKQDEWGYNFGFGFDINKIRIAFNYRGSFESLFQDNGNVKATGSYLTLGYRF